MGAARTGTRFRWRLTPTSLSLQPRRDCYDACAATPDCKYGNCQKIENDKCPDDEPLGFPYASQQGKGACYMFNGECTGSKSTGSTGIGEENVCWNLCSKVSSTTTTTL